MEYSTAEGIEKSSTSLLPFLEPKKRWSVRFVTYVALLAVLTSCTPFPPVSDDFSCTTFTESYWEEFRFDVDTGSDVVSRAIDLWGIEREQVQMSLRDNGEVASVRWRSDAVLGEGSHYYVPFYEVQQLKKIYAEWGDLKPTLTQVIDCLGYPSHYIAFYDIGPGGDMRSLTLFYSDVGLVVRHYDLILRFQFPGIHPNMRMDEFVVVPPAPAEPMATHLYSYGNETRHHARTVCLLKPWPGAVEAMEIASNEEVEQCGVFRDWQWTH